MESLDEASDETYLELLYLHNRDAFNKDSRKSQKRAEMRSVMGTSFEYWFGMRVNMLFDRRMDGRATGRLGKAHGPERESAT